jgi:hypothetical protein
MVGLQSRRELECELTNSTDLNTSRDVASCAVTQELPNILWNPKVHYRVHKSSLLIPILNKINPVYTTSSDLSKTYISIIHHLRLGFPIGLP